MASEPRCPSRCFGSVGLRATRSFRGCNFVRLQVGCLYAEGVTLQSPSDVLIEPWKCRENPWSTPKGQGFQGAFEYQLTKELWKTACKNDGGKRSWAAAVDPYTLKNRPFLH